MEHRLLTKPEETFLIAAMLSTGQVQNTYLDTVLEEKETEDFYNGCSLRINKHDDFYIHHRSDTIMAEGLTLGQYHYWDDYDDDCTKRFHFFVGSDGKDHHIDFSPYYMVVPEDIEAVQKFVEQTGRIPERWDNNGNNFHKGDIFKILKRVCVCGEVDCSEAYVHTTSGY